MANYYDLLGISSNASDIEIRAAYRKKAKLYHPDVNKSPDAHSVFVMLRTAYETLINPNKRERYNAKSKSKSDTTQSYQEYVNEKKARAEWEAKMRYYEFLRNREKFRQSKYYRLAIWVTQIARFVAIMFGVGVIAVSIYLIYDLHFMLIFCLLPFICGGIYLIKWTGDWYKETRRYF